jgi:hypothetical protein
VSGLAEINRPGKNRSVTSPREVIDLMREILGIPVNFIQSDKPEVFGTPIPGLDLPTAKAIILQTGIYQWRCIGGRHVVLPDDPLWDREISGIMVARIPRLEASIRYAAEVRKQLRPLDDLAGPIMKGDPGSPVYSDPVSLSQRSSVVGHLTELLGDDNTIVFTVERSRSGQRMLHFQKVPYVSPGPAALQNQGSRTCRT